MASVVNDQNSLKRILFKASDGKRRAIRLGKASRKQAEAFKVRVEQLVSTSLGHPPDDEVVRWVAGLDDVLHTRLAAVGLVAPRDSSRLGSWLNKFMSTKTDLKPGSIAKLGQTADKLRAFFPEDVPLRKMTPDRASDWRHWLAAQGLSEASVKIHVGNAKTIFLEAQRRKLVSESPFGHLKGGCTATRNKRYITPEETEGILGACPDGDSRIAFGLARLAGLRCESETHILTWGDVDWERGRLIVRSPKTERHAGHERRVVPITPRLMELLQDRFDRAEPGAERIVSVRGTPLRRRVERAIGLAKVEPWAGLWQTCRSSCEKQWAMEFPQYAVSKWIGHSITVSGRHYANDVPDELFREAAQKAAQQGPETARKGSQERQTGVRENRGNSASDSKLPQVPERAANASAGFDSPHSPVKTSTNPMVSGQGGANCGAPADQADLKAIADAWPAIPEAVRETLRAAIRAGGKHDDKG